MKRLFLGTLLLASMFSFPLPMMAEVSVNIGFSMPLPPVIQFHEAPRMVVLPGTYVYVAPDVDVDIFFTDGWWWRPYRGQWYRSHDYNSGWSHHRYPPTFYNQVNRHWRDDYRKHQWKGHRWNPEQRDHREVQKNWNNWNKERHWEKNNNWGVQQGQHKQNEGHRLRQEDRGKYDRNDRNKVNNQNNRHGKNDKHNKYDKHDKH